MIPATAHFIWIGNEFSWLSWAAVASAARRGGFERVVLHHTHDLSHARRFRELAQLDNVEARRLDELSVIERFGGARLVERYRSLDQPAARSNVLRLGLLASEGGVYLDLDTVTIAALARLRAEAGFFCGTEHVAFPASVRRSRDPLAWAVAFGRTALRDVLRRSEDGVHWFRKVARHYPVAANNAVIGCEPGHAFVHELGERILRLSPAEAQRRFALGTVLLQTALAETRCRGIHVHPPELFYPLGPELSAHWFRRASNAQLDEVLSPETRVVHWYASVRTRRIAPRVEPRWVERQGPNQLLSLLLKRALGSEERAPAAPFPLGSSASSPA